MKHVLILAAHFYPYKSGLENFALELGSGLAEKGIKVDVFTYEHKGTPSEEDYRGIHIMRFPSHSILGHTYTLPRFNKEYKKRIKKILSTKYDAIITNTRFFTTSYLGMVYAKKLKKKYGTKFIHIEHGNVHVIHNNLIVTLIAWLYDQTAGRMIFRAADIVVGISKPCAEFAKRLGAKKTIVIHNSIHTNLFFSKKTNLRKKLGIKKTDTVIINGIGRLIYAKGLHDTITAVKGIKNIIVITIGWGPYKEKLEAYAKEEGVNAIFTGSLSQKEVIEYLSIANIFINPSYSEGLPTCVLEAGAMGLPVIATDVGGTREIISNKNEGILITPKGINAIRKNVELLISNKKLGTAHGKALNKRIKKEFDWKTNLERFEDLI